MSFTFIRPLPCFGSIRFGLRKHLDYDDDNPDETHQQPSKANEVERPLTLSADFDVQSSVLLTGIRNRDCKFDVVSQASAATEMPMINYRVIPSLSNTMRNGSSMMMINQEISHYEEYDLDEQDFQWLIAYNQYRTDKHLPELDENIFEYIVQSLEHQCLVVHRQKNYEDTIRCDACHRLDDVDDLIQCFQCKIIVHKKCYGIVDHEDEWICLSCQDNSPTKCCCLCDQPGGALKSLIQLSDPTPRWVHLSCAFWFPTITFDEQSNPVYSETLPCDGRCSICCRTKGVKIQCSWKNCQCRFHAMCALTADQDMLIVESDDGSAVRLLALCRQHTEKIDSSEKGVQRRKFKETQDQRFEQFASYISVDLIQKDTGLLPDVLNSIHAYWLLKRQTNHGRPLVDIPDDILHHDYEKSLNLLDFARQYHLKDRNPTVELIEEKPNVLQFLAGNTTIVAPTLKNLFVRFAHRPRTAFIDYERNQCCLLDLDKTKRPRFPGSFPLV